ncbi:prostate and testis expressed protein 3 [Phyllostomus hastatus]|uniref:prostate and testis expressed protein 3 n=1 Tax=Phyllostomus hastatus TaxID=9423 RepID=UPI001E67E7F3|nr:prostate and testis expressed protein 3 [Phyllostomus hastatus]XP_045716281.1 prostate and testis expressed protein 3 [Phyllostomus hastatus]XP_045716282.1 prostate and testis expressed protein 3 [Phyllostomus hastatus]
MDRHVLLVFFLFCCFAAGTALKCITCHLHLTSDRCRSGFGVCVAKEEEKCMTLKVYNFGRKHLLSYMVCQRFCRAMKFLHHGRYFVYECCDQNYCNFKLGGTGATTLQGGDPERPSAETLTGLF